MTGTVKFFNVSKGYGFITNDETSEDIFVHVSALEGLTIKEGDKVEIESLRIMIEKVSKNKPDKVRIEKIK